LRKGLANFLPELALNHNHPISASQVAGITGMTTTSALLLVKRYFTNK
jgi:hypothetical protein